MYRWDPENSELENWDSVCVSIIIASWAPSIFAKALGRTGWFRLWSVAHPVGLGTSVSPNLFCLLGSCSRLNLLRLLHEKSAAQRAVRPEVACPRWGV
jgi:hypothetical protein